MPGLAASARALRVRGVVQGVGFRPFVFRLAQRYGLAGWVLNDGEGVSIHVEGDEAVLQTFVAELERSAPPAARIASLRVAAAGAVGCTDFRIRESERQERPSTAISPDLPVCDACLAELFDPADRRRGYAYINCTNCGPRFSVILSLPYDRPATTMKDWPMCAECAREYHDPGDRRFHAQPVACPACGPDYVLRIGGRDAGRASEAVREAARLLREGKILALKGLGGYHLACDAENASAVGSLRERKFRKEKPFALMVADAATARTLVYLPSEAEQIMSSTARPILLGRARVELAGVAPDNRDLGVMLPYAPLHHLLFAHGAPTALVMTSGNRSSEPIAYQDGDALEWLSGIADAFLVGERPIARRTDDSVAVAGPLGPVVLRRARGYAPGVVARLPLRPPILALGADLKNSVTLVVDGAAIVSQHIGDLEHYQARRALEETVSDFMTMYGVDPEALTLVHDAHPQYVSTGLALTLPCHERRPIQHHRAHAASVLAERGAFETRVLGVILDGTGYGDDGTIWGGEFFAGSLADGLSRVAHLRPAWLPGGDAAAQFPVQAAAGLLAELDHLPDLTAAPFHFPQRYLLARELIRRKVRTFATTSTGRLFDSLAALLGFTREITFEGQAAIWLEHLARGASGTDAYPTTFSGGELDFRPLLQAVLHDRQRGRDIRDIARASHRGLAGGVGRAIRQLCDELNVSTAVLSGGVFQNQLLMSDLVSALERSGIVLWMNRWVPPNDGGISLGQAALAAIL